MPVSPPPEAVAWVDDALAAGAVPGADGEPWDWVSADPVPFSGALANQSEIAAALHQHYFTIPTATMNVNPGDVLFAYRANEISLLLRATASREVPVLSRPFRARNCSKA